MSSLNQRYSGWISSRVRGQAGQQHDRKVQGEPGQFFSWGYAVQKMNIHVKESICLISYFFLNLLYSISKLENNFALK